MNFISLRQKFFPFVHQAAMLFSLVFFTHWIYLVGFTKYDYLQPRILSEVFFVITGSLWILRRLLNSQFRSFHKSDFLTGLFFLGLIYFFLSEHGYLPGTLEQPLFDLFLPFSAIGSFLIFMSKSVGIILRIGVKPPVIMALSFFILILVGTLLLLMPNATQGNPISIIDAMFTAVSASCVTGLIVVDTATQFTLLGKIIIFMLFQVGGFGIIMLSYFLISLTRMNVSLNEKIFFADFMHNNESANLAQTLKKIFFSIIFIEIAGALLIWSSWYDKFSLIEGFWFSIFHAVSAFCNAGFSLFSKNLMDPLAFNNVTLLIAIMFLIVAGSLGFLTYYDLVQKAQSYFKNKKYRFSIQSKIGVTATIVLVVTAAILFYFSERTGELQGQGISGQILHSFFQSVTLRTAGFNSLDFAAFLPVTISFMLIFMYIGGVSGGTAGGVKINTVVAIYLSIRSTLRGEKQIVISNRSIGFKVVQHAIIIMAFALLTIFISILILSFSEPRIAEKNFLALVFETVSAFGTVGLSQGITAELSTTGKIVIALNMFIGRIGPLTLILALSRRSKFVDYEYPEENFMVG